MPRGQLMLLAVALAVALAACGYDGVGEEAFLPAQDLVHPDAAVISRTFTPDERINTIDGANRYHPATVTVDLRFTTPDPVDEAALEAWYREQLARQGWTENEDGTGDELHLRQEAGGYHHRYEVDHQGDGYRVTYVVRDPVCDTDCFAR